LKKISAITRKNQVTIPVKIMREAGLEKGMKVAVWREGRKIVMEPLPSIFSLAGCAAGKATPAEMKKLLDEMREEDA
jgi:bifunctional DNA-binding transcriptional regulator/antitoxin component of YhaV-PrlF toxin-antitoxin module